MVSRASRARQLVTAIVCATSVNVANGRGAGPVHQFSNCAKLADAKDRGVVAPNADTLYADAWLDLRRRPQVIHTAKGTKRYHVLPLMSPYEESFATVGSASGAYPDGDDLVTGPGYRGPTPKGLTRIRSPDDRVWIIGRTEINGTSDLAATEKVMRSDKITPLNRWNPKRPYADTPPKPATRRTTVVPAHVPGTAPGEDPATFFDALGDQLAQFPPPAADRAILARIATLGIGPGQHPTQDGTLSDAQLQGLRDAAAQGPAFVQSNVVTQYLAGLDRHNGWFVAKTGHDGTDDALRAMVDKVGLGAPTPNGAVYPTTQTDRTQAPLSGVLVDVASRSAHRHRTVGLRAPGCGRM